MATVLVTGASGMLGQHLVPMLEDKGHRVLTPSREDVDLTDAAATSAYMTQHRSMLLFIVQHLLPESLRAKHRNIIRLMQMFLWA